jgi:hypothetical protein
VKDGIAGEKWPVNLACDSDFHVNHRVLLHTAKLRHGTDGFTSPPKEGMLRNFSPEKSEGFGRVRTRDLDTRMCNSVRKGAWQVLLESQFGSTYECIYGTNVIGFCRAHVEVFVINAVSKLIYRMLQKSLCIKINCLFFSVT